MVRQALDWLEERTGLESAINHFLYEDIPASAGWHQVLGSVALFCFMIQIVTGLLLAFNYAPTPGEAHSSVRYIMTEVTGGKLIRGLHHWGASMMIVVVVMHMVQVFLWGAYKKPREATWLVGIVLLLLTLGFGLTGYLLPWDNRAYWGTVVTTQIAAKSPGLGAQIERLLGSENGVGVVTFARFYTMHVMLLPLITTLIVGVHIYLVRRHGVAPAPNDTAPKKKFFPGQVFKDTVAIFIAFCVLFALAVFLQAPLGRLADPTDTTYVPRPEWYFLFLFQTLKFFEGPLEVVGAHVLPGLAIGALAMAPFIDRGALRKVTQRTTAWGIALLAGAVWAGLTIAAMRSTPPETDIHSGLVDAPEWQALSPEELAGLGHFRKQNCYACHVLGEKGKAIGPDLTKPAVKRDAAWHITHFKAPAEVVPGSAMPPVTLPDKQLNALAALMLQLKPGSGASLDSAPDAVVNGAMVYQQQQCGICHQANGFGMKVGPALNGLASRRQRDWVIQHFKEPQKLVPGSTMPPYRLPEQQLADLTTYLMELPARAPSRD
ncbi:MAG: cytochrome b N-terminal domain-containing protein [Bryobacterales bacterium]|nr:cytochrome b N-terminal domain-containing protein [Bryobacterales bacterium]